MAASGAEDVALFRRLQALNTRVEAPGSGGSITADQPAHASHVQRVDVVIAHPPHGSSTSGTPSPSNLRQPAPRACWPEHKAPVVDVRLVAKNGSLKLNALVLAAGYGTRLEADVRADKVQVLCYHWKIHIVALTCCLPA